MNGARFGNAVHVGPPAATARPLRNAPPPRLPPDSPSPSPASQYYTVLAHYIVIISSVVSTNFPARVSPSASKYYLYLCEKCGRIAWPKNMGLKKFVGHTIELVSPTVTHCLTVYNNNVLSIGNFVTKIILGLLKYVMSNVQVRSCLSEFWKYEIYKYCPVIKLFMEGLGKKFLLCFLKIKSLYTIPIIRHFLSLL